MSPGGASESPTAPLTTFRLSRSSTMVTETQLASLGKLAMSVTHFCSASRQ